MIDLGVVLAGGRSRRMGRDKAVLVVEGERLVDRAVATLSTCCDTVVVASGDGRRLADLAVAQVADIVPGEGPLAGILPALVLAGRGTVAVLAVDVARADAGVLRRCAALLGTAIAAVPVVEGRSQPLHAVWDAGRHAEVRAAFDAGERSPVRLLERAGARLVVEHEWRDAASDGADLGRSLNQPGDLATESVATDPGPGAGPTTGASRKHSPGSRRRT